MTSPQGNTESAQENQPTVQKNKTSLIGILSSWYSGAAAAAGSVDWGPPPLKTLKPSWSQITSKLSPPPPHKVIIFSRSARSNYLWLMSQLRSPSYGDLVQEVRDVSISNDYSQFTSHLSECTFAILYHTRKHGRLNITDVEDSLYDKELEDLYLKLGREKVMVVIDDLEVSSEEEKIRILQNQPRIRTWAGEMFIFSEEERKQRNTSSSSGDLVEDEIFLEKMQRMREFIKQSNK